MANYGTNLKPSTLLREQERTFARVFSLLEQAVRERAFPGASLAVVLRDELVAWRAFGRFTYDADSPRVTPTTVFDLASVTKVVATTAMAMILHERGRLPLDAPLVDLLPEFALQADGRPSADARRRQVTPRMLLAHSAGLIDYEKLFLRATTARDLLWLALTSPLVEEPLARACYSDIGFIILGELLSRLAGEPLDRFCRREVFQPLGMNTACFCPPAEWRTSIPPTQEDREFRMRFIQGEVDDENASVMGGVSGHAGLFGNAMDVALFARSMLAGGAPILRPETVRLFTARQAVPLGTSRALGLDTPSSPSQSGQRFSPPSFGHLGYTGTSLWCDPERQLAVVLLTNRTWPDRRSQEIKRVRPRVHDEIVAAIEEDFR
ncbi:MAG: serine hydrolase domain-containing protein [Candidatus Korobacteraceae bacterium]|jgi:CubicO group peptidase (beta-lactamase class C family)